MNVSYIVMLGIALVAFVVLLKRARAGVSAAALGAVNIAAMIGIGWFVASMLYYDGVMVVELAMCLTAIAVLAALTKGGFALLRRSRRAGGLVLLTIGAVPALMIYGFLLYLDANPIDWK